MTLFGFACRYAQLSNTEQEILERSAILSILRAGMTSVSGSGIASPRLRLGLRGPLPGLKRPLIGSCRSELSPADPGCSFPQRRRRTLKEKHRRAFPGFSLVESSYSLLESK
jgi:hypothetical protein